MFETYRMLGQQREAELFREALRLQVGVATRPRRTVQRASLPILGTIVLKSNARSLLWRLVANLGAIGSDVEDERGTRQQGARTGR